MANGALFGMPNLEALQEQERASVYSLPSAMASMPRGRGPVFAAGLLGSAIGDALTTSDLETKIAKVKKAYESAGDKKDFKDPLAYMESVAEALAKQGLTSEALQVTMNANKLRMEKRLQEATIESEEAQARYKQMQAALEKSKFALNLKDTISQMSYREALTNRQKVQTAFEQDKIAWQKQMNKKYKENPNYVPTEQDRFNMMFFSQTPEKAIDLLLRGALQDSIERMFGQQGTGAPDSGAGLNLPPEGEIIFED